MDQNTGGSAAPVAQPRGGVWAQPSITFPHRRPLAVLIASIHQPEPARLSVFRLAGRPRPATPNLDTVASSYPMREDM